MSASPSAAAGVSGKTNASHPPRQVSQASRNGTTGGNQRKQQNGTNKADYKADGARRSPQNGSSNQQAKSKQQAKPKAAGMSEFLRQQGATAETAQIVAQLRADMKNYFSEESVYKSLLAHKFNVETTRAALNDSRSNSWASKVVANAAASSSAPVPAPAHIAQQQQGPRPRKVRAPQEKKTTTPETPAVVEPVVDPEQMEQRLESALQAHETQAEELKGLKARISALRNSRAELVAEKEGLAQKITQLQAEIAAAQARTRVIESSITEEDKTLAELNKTLAQKIGAQ